MTRPLVLRLMVVSVLASALPAPADAQEIPPAHFPRSWSTAVLQTRVETGPRLGLADVVASDRSRVGSARRGLLIGLLAGAAVGGMLGAIAAPDGPCDWVCTRSDRMVVGAAVGGSVGAVGGLAFGLIRY